MAVIRFPDAPRHTGSGAPPCPTVIRRQALRAVCIHSTTASPSRVALSASGSCVQPYLREGGYRYLHRTPWQAASPGKSVSDADRDVLLWRKAAAASARCACGQHQLETPSRTVPSPR
ncbi:hypothetical protein KCP76_20310 [Salmonella enterica subsp. enterica serovar Weltevreden]|nr:hypothetical protein KCP76_20310 [Salmonella enterica subsp. enterica serovar Weltevreden]